MLRMQRELNNNYKNIRQRVKTGDKNNLVLRQSSSQLAAHSKSAVKQTQRYDGAVHKLKKMAGSMSSRIAVEQRRYAAGMVDTQG